MARPATKKIIPIGNPNAENGTSCVIAIVDFVLAREIGGAGMAGPAPWRSDDGTAHWSDGIADAAVQAVGQTWGGPRALK